MREHPTNGYVRRDDVVWRLGPDRVIVRRVTPIPGTEDCVDLFGSAALAWVAAERPIDATQISSDTGLSDDQVAEACTLLENGHWLSRVAL